MPHHLRSTELDVLQRSKHVETAVSTSSKVAKNRLCVAMRRASFQTRSMGASCGLYGGRNKQGEHGAICSKQRLEQDRVVDAYCLAPAPCRLVGAATAQVPTSPDTAVPATELTTTCSDRAGVETRKTPGHPHAIFCHTGRTAHNRRRVLRPMEKIQSSAETIMLYYLGRCV